MIHKIVDGISEKLNIVFGDNYKIYTESEKQGFHTPCFFIQLAESASNRKIGERFFRENLFCIHYYPASTEEPLSECYQMQDDLYLALEYITVDGDLQRGINMRSEFADSTLNLFVNYNNSYVVRTEEKEPMGEIETPKISVKG